MTTISTVFEQSVLREGNRPALYDTRTQKRWTFQQWKNDVDRLALTLLEKGVAKGDRVSCFLLNTAELATVFLASAKIGAVFNPINFRLKPEEVSYILRDAQPKILFFEQALEPVVGEIYQNFPDICFCTIDSRGQTWAESFSDWVERKTDLPHFEADIDENDLCEIMYTSGTTGRPKGVLHTHRDIIDQSMIIIAGQQLTKNDRGLVTAPMFHCAELHCAFFPRLHVGAENVILHRFDPKQVLSVMEKEKITVTFMAPTMWNMLLQEDPSRYDLRSLRLGLYGAAPMAPVLVKKVKEAFQVKLLQAYGMTEMGPAITFLDDEEQLTKAGSAGKACLNHEIRVIRTGEGIEPDPNHICSPGEIGRIIVRGPSMMKGYYGRPEATNEALSGGWYFSGDLGYMDEDGYLWVADRMDDMIISGGENIYPREVEDALYEHPGVLDVAVVGEADVKWGEIVVAYVVKKEKNLTSAELESFCRQSRRLSDYKRPRKYIFVEDLPRNASGKIQKFKLRKRLENRK